MQRSHFSFAGFIAATVTAALILAVIGADSRGSWILSVICLLPLALGISFSVTLFLGLPFYLLLAILNIITWWTTITAGAIIGALAIAAIKLPNGVVFGDLAFAMPVGAISSLVFWLVWSRGRHTEGHTL